MNEARIVQWLMAGMIFCGNVNAQRLTSYVDPFIGSGGHGHEMYPQQFVRLVGCHDASVEALRKREDEKLH